MRVICRRAERPAPQDPEVGRPASDLRQTARDAVQCPCAARRRTRACSITTRAPARSASKRSAAAHRTSRLSIVDPRALKLIDENVRHCGVRERYVIIRTPQSLPAGSIDLAVLDPPYDEPDLTASIAAAEPLIAPGGLLVLEHARRVRRRSRLDDCACRGIWCREIARWHFIQSRGAWPGGVEGRDKI